MTQNILLIGFGKMGQALYQGWQKDPNFSQNFVVTVIDPVKPDAALPLSHYDDIAKLPVNFAPDFILLAIKPQQMKTVLPSLQKFSSAVFLSIAAGISTKFLRSFLGAAPFTIRVMPNLPAQIGAGMSVLFTDRPLPKDAQQNAEAFFQSVGKIAWIDKEEWMNPITALSGSGPGFFFHLVDVMAKIGTEMGLPHDLAMDLARQSFVGSGALLAASPETAATLRDAVTSKGGTTEAGLQTLNQNDALFKLWEKALHAATNRAAELSE